MGCTQIFKTTQIRWNLMYLPCFIFCKYDKIIFKFPHFQLIPLQMALSFESEEYIYY